MIEICRQDTPGHRITGTSGTSVRHLKLVYDSDRPRTDPGPTPDSPRIDPGATPDEAQTDRA